MTKRKHIKLLPHEVFEKIEAAKSVDERVSILQENASYAIKTILYAAYVSPHLKWDLPEGAPPYVEDVMPAGYQKAPVDIAIKGISDLLVGSTINGKFPRYQKEKRFISMLEAIHAKDAKILIAMKDRNLKTLYPKLTPALVKKAYPNLI